jgi:hypothetical protein
MIHEGIEHNAPATGVVQEFPERRAGAPLGKRAVSALKALEI